MKKILSCLLAAAAFAFAAPASATVVTLHATLQSGATFDGELLFADHYQYLIDVDGTLSGASYGTIHFGWTWFAGIFGATSGVDIDGNPATVEDWLMPGDTPGVYDHYFGLSWQPGQAGIAFLMSPQVPVYHGGLDALDAMVSNAVSGQVPEPASLALFGLGLLGVLARRRRQG